MEKIIPKKKSKQKQTITMIMNECIKIDALA